METSGDCFHRWKLRDVKIAAPERWKFPVADAGNFHLLLRKHRARDNPSFQDVSVSVATVALQHCPKCGAVANPRWGQCIVCEAPLTGPTNRPTWTAGPQVVQLPSERKPESPTAEWLVADWQAYFDERAGIAEFDGGLERSEAERQAYQGCLVHWQWLHPPATDKDHCVHCGRGIGNSGSDAVLLLVGPARHVWIHHRCSDQWRDRRRAEAATALATFGVAQPPTHSVKTRQ